MCTSGLKKTGPSITYHCLTGKARSAFVAMDPSHTQDYDFVKTAILKKYDVNAETYRLRFP